MTSEVGAGRLLILILALAAAWAAGFAGWGYGGHVIGSRCACLVLLLVALLYLSGVLPS